MVNTLDLHHCVACIIICAHAFYPLLQLCNLDLITNLSSKCDISFGRLSTTYRASPQEFPLAAVVAVTVVFVVVQRWSVVESVGTAYGCVHSMCRGWCADLDDESI